MLALRSLRQEANRILIDFMRRLEHEQDELNINRFLGCLKRSLTVCRSFPKSAEVLSLEMNLQYNLLCAEVLKARCLLSQKLILTDFCQEKACLMTSLNRVGDLVGAALEEEPTCPVLRMGHFLNAVVEKTSSKASCHLDNSFKELEEKVSMVACLWALVTLQDSREGPLPSLSHLIAKPAAKDLKVELKHGFLLMSTPVAMVLDGKEQSVSSFAHYLQAVNSFHLEDWTECENHLDRIEHDKLFHLHRSHVLALVCFHHEDYNNARDSIYEGQDWVTGQDLDNCLALDCELHKVMALCYTEEGKARRATQRTLMMYKDLKPASERPLNLRFMIEILLRNASQTDFKLTSDRGMLMQQFSQSVLDINLTAGCCPYSNTDLMRKMDNGRRTIQNSDCTLKVATTIHRILRTLEKALLENDERQSILEFGMSELFLEVVVNEEDKPTLAEVYYYQAILFLHQKRLDQAITAFEKLIPVHKSGAVASWMPTLLEVYCLYVKLLWEAGQHDRCLQRCIKLVDVLNSRSNSSSSHGAGAAGEGSKGSKASYEGVKLQMEALSDEDQMALTKIRLLQAECLLRKGEQESALMVLRGIVGFLMCPGEMLSSPSASAPGPTTPNTDSSQQVTEGRLSGESQGWRDLTHYAYLCLCDVLLHAGEGAKTDPAAMLARMAYTIKKDIVSKYYWCRCLIEHGRKDEAIILWTDCHQLHPSILDKLRADQQQSWVWKSDREDRHLGAMTELMKEEMDEWCSPWIRKIGNQ